jgi:putative membrane protein
MSNYINACLFFAITTIVLLFAIFVFDRITRYKLWSEIMQGNLAVSLSTGGIVIGIANIMKTAISVKDDILQTLIWGGIGTIVLLFVYIGFEVLTPKLDVSEEISRGNKAVGFISLVFSIAFSMIISACIS